MKHRTIGLDEQVALNRKYAPAAISILRRFVFEQAVEIVELSEERLIGIGYNQYGDDMFHQTDDELVREILEELADAVNRAAVRAARMNGELHNPRNHS